MREDRVETEGLTSGIGLEHADEEDRRIVNRGGISGLRSAPNLIRFISTVLVPSVSQVGIIVIANVGGEGHLATFADVVFSRSNLNNDRVIYIYIVRSTFNAASMRVVNNNCVDVCIILRTANIDDGVVSNSGSADGVVVEQPCVSQFSTHVIVGHVGREHDHAVFADDRVAGNHNGRVRVNCQSVRSEGSD